MIRIVFMGTPSFSCGILQGLLDNSYNIVGCVSQMDKPVGRKQIMSAPPVKELANKYNIPVIQPYKLKEDYQAILDLKPDLIITCAYGQMIPKEVLTYPKYGCINVHASLLPKYRGGAPIHYAIINGDKKAGVTIMEMVQKMDAGDMLGQSSIDVNEEMTTEDLFNQLMIVGRDLLIEILPSYLKGDIKKVKQDEEKVSFAYNITKEQEYIDFYRDVVDVHNYIRGLLSWPVGHILIDDIKIKIHHASYLIDDSAEPGKVYGLENNTLKIGAINGYILISQLQVSGKNKQNAKEFFNGYQSKVLNKYVRRKEDVNQ